MSRYRYRLVLRRFRSQREFNRALWCFTGTLYVFLLLVVLKGIGVIP